LIAFAAFAIGTRTSRRRRQNHCQTDHENSFHLAFLIRQHRPVIYSTPLARFRFDDSSG
jgi:hypothetical protein